MIVIVIVVIVVIIVVVGAASAVAAAVAAAASADLRRGLHFSDDKVRIAREDIRYVVYNAAHIIALFYVSFFVFDLESGFISVCRAAVLQFLKYGFRITFTDLVVLHEFLQIKPGCKIIVRLGLNHESSPPSLLLKNNKIQYFERADPSPAYGRMRCFSAYYSGHF